MTEEEENLIGKEFAGCKIISKIGQGGMGTVYKAHHKALNKVVCVKLLAKELSGDKRNLEFFLREARSAAKLNHPNIVHVYNFGKENGKYFIVMSYIDGKSLQEIVETEGPLSIDKAVKFTVELLEGLGHAHSKGVIHRDIKPSNILVGSNGQSYLVDFGLAKSVSEEKELTQAGEMIGTAYFMSPEQCLAQKVDNRADLYAVGATFYYLITGKYPFDGKTSIEVMHKHIGTPPPDPILVNPDVPRWAAVFIEHSMKKKSDDRYQSAEEAKTELLDYSTGKKIMPTPGGDIILDLTSKLHNPDDGEMFKDSVSEDVPQGEYKLVPPPPPQPAFNGLDSLDSLSLGTKIDPAPLDSAKDSVSEGLSHNSASADADKDSSAPSLVSSSIGAQLDSASMDTTIDAFTLGANIDSAPESSSEENISFNSYSSSEGLTVDWNSGETLPESPAAATPPPPPAISPDGDPSMDAVSGTESLYPSDNTASYDDYDKKEKENTSIIQSNYESAEETREEESNEPEQERPHESNIHPAEKKSRFWISAQSLIKSVSCFALLIASSFFLVLAGAAGSGSQSLLNSFATNPVPAASFMAAGLVIAGLFMFLKPDRTPFYYVIYVILGAFSAFAGGAYISSGSDIASKLIQAVSMITQNTTGHLMSVYALSFFLVAYFMVYYSNKLFKIAGAVLTLFSIWLFFKYACIGHVFFGFNVWGIIASVSAVLAFICAFRCKKSKIFGQTLFFIISCAAVEMMICLPNINRAAENEYQKLNKQWAVFQEVQRTSGYFAAKSLEPKTKRRELFEFKEDERANYINKEKEKLVYAVTDGGGFIVLSFFMALISIMSFYVKPKDEPLEENY